MASFRRRKFRGSSSVQIRIFSGTLKLTPVPQPSAVLVDEFKFGRTVSMVNFDSGGLLAPISTDLSTKRNVSVNVPAGSSGTISIDSSYLWRGHLTHFWFPFPRLAFGEAGATARFVVSPAGKI